MMNGNPMQMAMQMMKQMGNNPMIGNLMQMGQKNDVQGAMDFARNMCKERGMDFDKEFAKFKSQYGLK